MRFILSHEQERRAMRVDGRNDDDDEDSESVVACPTQ